MKTEMLLLFEALLPHSRKVPGSNPQGFRGFSAHVASVLAQRRLVSGRTYVGSCGLGMKTRWTAGPKAAAGAGFKPGGQRWLKRFQPEFW